MKPIRQEIVDAVVVDGMHRMARRKINEPQFPTICLCPVCHGVSGCTDVITKSGKRIKPNGHEAFQLALLQHGTYQEKWAGSNVVNAKIIPFLCQCECHHSWALHSWGSQCRICKIKLERPDSSD